MFEVLKCWFRVIKLIYASAKEIAKSRLSCDLQEISSLRQVLPRAILKGEFLRNMKLLGIIIFHIRWGLHFVLLNRFLAPTCNSSVFKYLVNFECHTTNSYWQFPPQIISMSIFYLLREFFSKNQMCRNIFCVSKNDY